eukprot:3794804-Alexandrium_andersonii.AAC.1
MAADGGRIPNLGEVEVGFFAKEQHRRRIRFQAAAVKRPLSARAPSPRRATTSTSASTAAG